MEDTPVNPGPPVVRPTFAKELEHLINSHCRENNSDTPDFILAQYVMESLRAFERASNARLKFFGIARPAGAEPSVLPCIECCQQTASSNASQCADHLTAQPHSPPNPSRPLL